VEFRRNRCNVGLCKPVWVLGRSCVHGRPYLSLCPISLQLCNNSDSGPDEYAYGCRIKKGADWYPFCLGGGTKRGDWGCVVPQRGPPQKVDMLSKRKLPPGKIIKKSPKQIWLPPLIKEDIYKVWWAMLCFESQIFGHNTSIGSKAFLDYSAPSHF